MPAINRTSTRLRSITKEVTNLRTEKAHVDGTLQRNSYPAAFVKAASVEMTPRELNRKAEQGEGKPTLMMLPYVAGISERIRKACRSYNVRVVFRSGLTFQSVEKQANVVHEVPCSCGKVYIGETKRRFKTRIKDHREACIRGQTTKSAIAEHTWMEGHPVN